MKENPSTIPNCTEKELEIHEKETTSTLRLWQDQLLKWNNSKRRERTTFILPCYCFMVDALICKSIIPYVTAQAVLCI